MCPPFPSSGLRIGGAAFEEHRGAVLSEGRQWAPGRLEVSEEGGGPGWLEGWAVAPQGGREKDVEADVG